jgi:anti-sigma factor RsiW
MKCEHVSKELIAYLARRSNSAEREEVEAHLVECAACRSRAEEFRKLWNVLDEVQLVEPSLSFDAKVRQRIAAEPRPNWFRWLVPQPRLAFSMAFLVALCIWLARLPQENLANVTPNEQQQFEMIKDLGVLENYEVLTKFDALSELPPPAVKAATDQDEQRKDDGGA